MHILIRCNENTRQHNHHRGRRCARIRYLFPQNVSNVPLISQSHMKLIAALLKFILTSARKHNVGIKKKKKKAIYSSSLQYGASPGAEIAAEGRIISSQLMGDANKAEKNPTKTMNAKQNPSKLISFAEC